MKQPRRYFPHLVFLRLPVRLSMEPHLRLKNVPFSLLVDRALGIALSEAVLPSTPPADRDAAGRSQLETEGLALEAVGMVPGLECEWVAGLPLAANLTE